MSDDITLTIDDTKFSGWTEISIKRSIETLTGSFSFKVTDRKNQDKNIDWPIRTGAKAIVKINDKPLINGYVFKVAVNISPESHDITVSGRDKTADLVDTSAALEDKKFSIPKTNILKLAKALSAPYGIGVKVNPGTNVSETFDISINTSESPFEILDKRAKELGVLLISDSRGRLVISNSGNERANDSLVLGKNIIQGSVDYDYSNRFSKYSVFGQTSASNNWNENISIKTSAEDPNISRPRPLIIQAESGMDKRRAQKRVNWEAKVRAARSKNVSLTVQGFVQENGEPWEINQLVEVFAPALYINPATTLLITGVEFIVNNSGFFTHLTLKRKDAFDPIPGKKVKKENRIGW